jgi:hypothetical protein
MRTIIVGVIGLLVGVSVTQLRVERNKRPQTQTTQEHEKWLAQKLPSESDRCIPNVPLSSRRWIQLVPLQASANLAPRQPRHHPGRKQ